MGSCVLFFFLRRKQIEKPVKQTVETEITLTQITQFVLSNDTAGRHVVVLALLMHWSCFFLALTHRYHICNPLYVTAKKNILAMILFPSHRDRRNGHDSLIITALCIDSFAL